jgi:hypothetical protein
MPTRLLNVEKNPGSVGTGNSSTSTGVMSTHAASRPVVPLTVSTVDGLYPTEPKSSRPKKLSNDVCR